MNDSPPKTSVCPLCGKRVRREDGVCLSCGHVLERIEYGEAAADGESRVPEPRSIGPYHIRRILDRGGMGIVCEAWDEEAQRRVALKIVDGGLYDSASEEARLEREAWISGSLDHPNVIKVFGHGRHGPWHYLALELAEGPSLQRYLRGTGFPDTPDGEAEILGLDGAHARRMAGWFAGVADALRHIHERGIVHRDIKPGNLVFTAHLERLMLTDFGLARRVAGSDAGRSSGASGTFHYLAPELRSPGRPRGADLDPACDLYSFGVALYESVTLAFPYDAPDDRSYARETAERDPVPARSRNPECPEELSRILLSCLERDPARRWRSAGELASLLRSVSEGPGSGLLHGS